MWPYIWDINYASLMHQKVKFKNLYFSSIRFFYCISSDWNSASLLSNQEATFEAIQQWNSCIQSLEGVGGSGNTENAIFWKIQNRLSGALITLFSYKNVQNNRKKEHYIKFGARESILIFLKKLNFRYFRSLRRPKMTKCNFTTF